MSVRYALLGILAERERHGYDLKSAFDERVGEFWSLNYGQIYTTLDRLEHQGSVERREEAQQRRPDRKIYRVTAKGRSELEAWLARPLDRPRALRDELFIKLLFRSTDDLSAVLELLQTQQGVYLDHMRRLTKRKLELGKRAPDGDVGMTDLLIDAALFHAEADVRWLAHAEQKLRAASKRRARGAGARP